MPQGSRTPSHSDTDECFDQRRELRAVVANHVISAALTVAAPRRRGRTPR